MADALTGGRAGSGPLCWPSLVLCIAFLGGPLVAQEAPQAFGPRLSLGEAQTEPGVSSPIVTITQEQLFAGTLYGKAVQARIEEASRALQAENREIEADLEAEERDLTVRRATLPAEEFRALAEAFNTKVEAIRSAQEAKGRALSRQNEEDRQRFFQTAVPVLAALMTEMGAVAMVDRSAIVLSLERIDITDEAIARIDSVLGDGLQLLDEGQAPAGP